MDPDQLVEQAKVVGLDGVCITEHNQLWDPAAIDRLRTRHDFLVIGGVEVATDCGEVLAFGLKEKTPVREIYETSKLREIVDAAGGVLVWAHPFRGEPDMVAAHNRALEKKDASSEKYILDTLSWPYFDLMEAMEIYNGRSGLGEVNFTSMIAEKKGVKGTGGSDSHAILSVGSCYTQFENKISSTEDLIEEIKQGRFNAIDRRWKI